MISRLPLTAAARRLRRALLLIALATQLLPSTLPAQQPSTPTAVVPPRTPRVATLAMPHSAHPLTAADLGSWLDGMLPVALKQGDVGGAVVSVVQNGQVLLAKGYGFADVAHHSPMDPARTLVRPGSISKLFTWTAVMQLVEAGKLDLHADVNRYLDFRLPERFGRPITLTDLMTHRAGFEEGLKDAVVPSAGQLQPLGIFLRRHLRPTLFPPGEVPAYSNYGTALAGYIVERVSHERYQDYIARHIFMPLGMARSTFQQPLPPIPGTQMSNGYFSATDAPVAFELLSGAPEGALTTTADDMTHFMLAHLGDGRTGSSTILQPATARLMHEASLPALPGFDTMAHGFFREQRNGRQVLEHGGDTIVFHSDLILLPAEQVGLFVSFNSRGAGDAAYGIRQRLIDGFMDRYFPGPADTIPTALPIANADAARVAGRYETSRRVESGFMSLFYVLQGQEIVAANPDGTIALSSAPGKAFREVARNRWQEIGGERTLALIHAAGKPAIADSRDPVEYYQPVPLIRNASFNLTVLALSVFLLFAAAVAWMIAEGTRRAYRQPSLVAGRALWVRRLARIAVVADLAYLFAWAMALKPILGSHVEFYTSARDPIIRGLQFSALVPLLGAGAGVANAWLSLSSGRSWTIKAGSILGAAALFGVLWIALVGGLASLTLNY